MNDEAIRFLKHTRVPGWARYHVLGCFERRVTLYSQQVRALNLVWALHEVGEVSKGDKVAIIGGGAAGLMAAAAGRRLGWEVTVLERAQSFLPLQRGCTHRFVHPHVYDWPDEESLNEGAGLPLMNWRAAYADAVVRQLDEAWERFKDPARDIHSVNSIEHEQDGTLQWTRDDGGLGRGSFKAIILATGFGVERDEHLPVTSYWRSDGVHQANLDGRPKRYLVSGCGDGGLVDLLRVRLLDFRHDQIVQQLASLEGYAEFQATIREIEQEVRALDNRGSREAADKLLNERYAEIKVHPAITEAVKLRADTEATICYQGPGVHSLRASALNRALVALVFQKPGTRLCKATLTRENVCRQLNGQFEVDFGSGAPEVFDEVIVRHGPKSALQRGFPRLFPTAEGELRPRSELDDTRKPLWPSCFFGDEPAPMGGKSGAVTTASSTSLADYLARLRDEVGRVRLAGDTEEHSLEKVFVELEVTDSDLVKERDLPSEDEGEQRGELDRALHEETQRRVHAPWKMRTETIAADDLLSLSPRTLIVGAAGSGKSTLLRRVAWTASGRRAENEDAPIPVWLRKLPAHDELKGDLEAALARKAFEWVGLDPGGSAGFVAVRDAIRGGRALLLIDGLDESDSLEHLHAVDWMKRLHAGVRVLMVSRPLLSKEAFEWCKRLTLHGLPRIAAELMLRQYFPGATFIDPLFDALQNLPDGQHWQETPVLLGLATTLFRVDQRLPSSLGDLYDRVIEHLLSSKHLPEGDRGRALRPGLAAFARSVLVPEEGPPRVLFDDATWNAKQRALYPKTGLFEGERPYRFSHLTLGERLAAEAPIDLARERRRLRSTEARKVEGNALEVLPMAHAIQGARALQEAFEDARLHDCSDHRLLRLLLRAIGYGGDGVRAFVSVRGIDVFRLVLDRFQMPSGRFGEAERALLDTAERAFIVLRDAVQRYAEEINAAVAPLIGTHGDVAAEAALLPWLLGVGDLALRPAAWWATIYRQARALVRAYPDVDEVIQRTSGFDDFVHHTAIEVLGLSREHWPRLRPFLDDRSRLLRETALKALAPDAGAEVALRERLSDGDAGIRGSAIRILACDPARVAVYLDRVRGALHQDQANEVLAAAVHVLAGDVPSWPVFRRMLEEALAIPKGNIGVSWVWKRNALLHALATDELAAPLIERYIKASKNSFADSEDTLGELSQVPRWHTLLLARLRAADVAAVEVQALAEDPDAKDLLIPLLELGNKTSVVAACIRALRGQRELQGRFVTFLSHEEIDIRCAAIDALSVWEDCWPHLRKHLDADSEYEVRAAINALRHDRESLERMMELLDDERHNVRAYVIPVLAKDPGGRARLREYFRATKGVQVTGDVHHDTLRPHVLKRLADDTSQASRKLLLAALQDKAEDDDVRAAAATALADDPSMRSQVLEFLYGSRFRVVEAICRALPEERSVQERLLSWLPSDLGHLRHAACLYLVDRKACRTRLRERLLDASKTSQRVRRTIVWPLTRDPESKDLLVECACDDDYLVRATAIAAIGKRSELRRRLRELATDAHWLVRQRYPLRDDGMLDVLAEDPEAYPILHGHLASDDRHLLAAVAPLLANHPPAYDRLVELFDHSDDSVRREAMKALGRSEHVRSRILGAFDDPDRWTREAAAEALRAVPEARHHFRRLLADKDKSIRRIAVDVLENDGDPETRRAFRDRLVGEKEPDEELRKRLLDALRGDPESRDLLRERLHHDTAHWVRIHCAGSLSPEPPALAHPFQEQAPIQRALACMGLSALHPSTAGEKEALQSFLHAPARLERDANPDLFELVLAWACIRLTFASPDGELREGRIFGEVEAPIERLSENDRTLVIRVAMDHADLPRERNLRPNHNLIETWRIAKHLVTNTPTSLVLACADVDFEHLVPPPLDPGQVLWGPTFFGFRLSGV